MPKQTDIDKILEIIRKKVLKGTHLPLTIKEIQAGYLNSLYFKDIYIYLVQNRLPSKKAAMKRVEILAEKYKTYLTINDRFFIPNLMHYLRSYIKGCHICQLNRKDKLPVRQLQTRININYRPLLRLSMDLKVMPRSCRGYRYI